MDEIAWLIYCWECHEWVRRVDVRLTRREARVLSLRQGWMGGRKLWLREIGRELGMTEAAVRNTAKTARKVMQADHDPECIEFQGQTLRLYHTDRPVTGH